jgi:signal transduction histidine kinase
MASPPATPTIEAPRGVSPGDPSPGDGSAVAGDLPLRSYLRRVDPHVWDAILAFVVTAASFVFVFAIPDAPGFNDMDAAGVVLLLAMTLPLFVLRAHPFTVFVTVGVAAIVSAYLGSPAINVAVWTGGLALFVTAAKSPILRSMVAALAASAVLIIVYYFLLTADAAPWWQGVVQWFVFSLLWVAGVAYHFYRESVTEARQRARLARESADRERERAQLYRHEAEMQAVEAVTLERARLARELHDVVGHTLNIVVLQAGAARRVFDKRPAVAREALDSIESAARQALADIERLLGMLRAEESEAEDLGAQPGFAEIERVIDQVREAGLPVEYAVEGRPVALPQSIDLSAYRIVQEGLTNALKHAGAGARAEVRISYTDDELCVEILDDGGAAAGAARAASPGDGQPGSAGPAGGQPSAATQPGAAGPAAVGPSAAGPSAAGYFGGRGLVGMRERVMLFGGQLDVGPRPEGGFRVRACFPLGGLVLPHSGAPHPASNPSPGGDEQ